MDTDVLPLISNRWILRDWKLAVFQVLRVPTASYAVDASLTCTGVQRVHSFRWRVNSMDLHNSRLAQFYNPVSNVAGCERSDSGK